MLVQLTKDKEKNVRKKLNYSQIPVHLFSQRISYPQIFLNS